MQISVLRNISAWQVLLSHPQQNHHHHVICVVLVHREQPLHPVLHARKFRQINGDDFSDSPKISVYTWPGTMLLK